MLVTGLALVLLGAAGATVVGARTDARPRAAWLPLRLVPFGVLMGAGAALVRDWHLWGSMAAGAVLVPLVGAVGRWWEVRRRRGGRR